MKSIFNLFILYIKGYRIIGLCDCPETYANCLYYVVNKSQIDKNFVKKSNHTNLLSVKGYRILKNENASIFIG